MSQDQKLGPSPEQVLYANILNKGMLLGLVILLITFALYVFGIVSPYVPLDELSRYWSQPVNDYLHELDIPTGWAWLGMLGYSDFLNFIGIAFLAGVSIICYIAIVPTPLACVRGRTSRMAPWCSMWIANIAASHIWPS